MRHYFDKIRALSFYQWIGLLGFLLPSLVLILSERSVSGLVIALLTIALLFSCAWGITGRWGLSGFMTGFVLIGIYKIHQVKLSLMNQPFLATDIISFFSEFRANASIIWRYENLVWQLILAVLVFVIFVVLMFRAEPSPVWNRRILVPLRASTVLVGILTFPILFTVVKQTDFAFLRPLKIVNSLIETASKGRVLSKLVLSARTIEASLPPQNFPDLEASRQLFQTAPPVETGADHPDIILWHNESTFDPAMLSACNVPQCQFQMFQPDASTVTSGLLQVHCFGGASWTSEFALLTGLNHENFGEAGMYTHFTLAPRIKYSLPLLLKKYGYRTVALYPNNKNFFNAVNAYRHYGFDEFYDPDDFKINITRNGLTDEDMAKEMAKILIRESRQPLLIYVLTQFQHGPHSQSVKLVPEPYRSLQFEGLNEETRVNLVNYLYRLSLTDATIRSIEKRFLNENRIRKTIFMQYGDHQPGFDGLMLGLAKRGMEQFPPSMHHLFTKFSFQANFPIEAPEKYDSLDISFLGSMILEVANLAPDEYYAATTKLRKLCKGKYLNCENREAVLRYQDYILYGLGAIRPLP
jgi:phosphoglycerol transferase MdoB-like AlkP superfamily enzyme